MTDKPRGDVTETELAVMQVLWERGAASIRQVTDLLYPGGATSHYATVQKLLDRLEAKGFVSRDRTLHVHLFSAQVGREELVGRRIQQVVDTLCEGSLVPVLTHLAGARGLSEDERRALRQLVRRRTRKN
ncbi:MAG TPA: BlaI/MecI/CopY family transcriptional regulator [Humisphaera sp.]|jgi:predicted transcriptional regulator|nr:BlaI/MecI/CopY family transcriptional regulator [Humisphaera sp.]